MTTDGLRHGHKTTATFLLTLNQIERIPDHFCISHISTIVSQVDETNSLDLRIDRFLSWDEHIKNVIKQCIYAQNQMVFLCNPTTLETI